MCNKNCCNHTYHAIIFLFILSFLLLPNIPNLNSFLNELTNNIRSHATTKGGGDCGGGFLSPPCTATTTKLILAFLYGALFTLVLMIISSNWDVSSKQADHHQPSTSSSASPSYRPAYVNPTNDGSGDGEGGVGYALLRTFPTFAYSARWRPKMGRGSKACVICQYKFRDQELVRWLPDCDHIFHLSCIDEWLMSHKTCPCCRAVLDSTASISPNDDFYYYNEYYYNVF